MRRFLIALLAPIVIVALINVQTLWRFFGPKLNHPSATDQAKALEAEPALADNHLRIPALAIEVPVVGSAVDPTDLKDWSIVRRDLTHGVSLAEKLAGPGQPGTTLILGHSSDTAIHPYASVFAGLNSLKENDLIELRYKGQLYRYQAKAKQIVGSRDRLFFDEFKRSDIGPQLALVTCWPILTTAERLVIIASPVAK